MRLWPIFALLLITLLPLRMPAQEREGGLFDPQRHMRVAEVKPGMKGYGLSVFRGTQIERFDVEVISVLRSFNVKGDVILIRCSGQNLEHTGPVAGMSGSPIYLYDETGKARMVGAFAYGWALMKDPIAGVQPIEYMLDIAQAKAAPAAGDAPTGESRPNAATPIGPARWRLPAEYITGWSAPPQFHPLLARLGLTRAGSSPADAQLDAMRLRRLSTPLMASGMPPRVREMFEPILANAGFVPMQAGAGGNGGDAPDVEIAPGSVLAIPLLIGDLDLTAIGTATEVIDGRVFGFGHPMDGAGEVKLPMASGSVDTVVASLLVSFKLGSMGQIRGTLTRDEAFGISGVMGQAPELIPIELRVVYPELGEDRTYRFQAVSHPQYTPLLATVALMSAVTGVRDLPPYHTLDYDLTIEFENGRVVRLQNTIADTYSRSLFFQVGIPMMTAADNPFEEVMVRGFKGEVRVHTGTREAEILSVVLPRTTYTPGQTVKAFVLYRPFRGPEAVLPVEFELPREIPEGEYFLSVGDWQHHLMEEQASKPFRFIAQSADEIFDVINDVMAVQRTALYIRLLREADGIAIGRTAMPHLPSSRRQIMLSAGRSNTTPFVSSTVKVIPTDYVMSGAAQFSIKIERDAKVQPPARPRGEAGAPRQPAPTGDTDKPDQPPSRRRTEPAPAEPSPSKDDTQPTPAD
mgnify:CR=1 FL=1